MLSGCHSHNKCLCSNKKNTNLVLLIYTQFSSVLIQMQRHLTLPQCVSQLIYQEKLSQ